MQLKQIMITVSCAVMSYSMVSPATAAIDEQDANYLFRYFSDANDVGVWSHYGNYSLNLENGVQGMVRWNHEVVMMPAIEAQAGTPEALDAITTASRPISSANGAFEEYRKTRDELQADVGTERVNLGYYLSTESDYFAQQVRGSTNVNLFDQNLNLSFGSSYGWDQIDPLVDDDTTTPEDSKSTLHMNAVATQILSPTTILRVGGEINWVDGLLHNPYRNVYAGGGPEVEVHPSERVRRDVFVRVHQYLKNRSSIKLEYRLYGDDWGVGSHTLGTRLSQYITNDVVVRYRYRYYTQTAADFYREEYETSDGVDGFRTGDYRLEDFNSHLFGAQLGVNLGALPIAKSVLQGFDLSVKYERYFNSNNFSANVLETGLAYRF